MLPIRTILHPTDFSPLSACALQLASALARDYGAEIIILHVAEPAVAVYGEGMIPPLTADEYNEFLEVTKEKLEQIRPAYAHVRFQHRLVEGNPASEILRAAREGPCDLIVMGTHGRTGVGRLLMGSVAEQVVRKASCPVLTVKAPFVVAEPVAAEATQTMETTQA